MSRYSSSLAALAVLLFSWWVWYLYPGSHNPIFSEMKACIRTSSGPAFTESHPKPADTPRAGELLVRIRAAAINPVDYKVPRILLGPVMGLDYAGIVEAVSDTETKFQVGDEVYG